jgi:hypothetical protein
MKIVAFVKEHPGEAAVGAAAVIAVIYVAYTYLSAGSSSSSAGTAIVSSGPDDAQVEADDALTAQQAQIQGALATQSNQLSLQQESDAANLSLAQIQAQVQQYTVQQSAAVNLAGISAQDDETDTATAGQLAAIEAQVNAQTQQANIAANAAISTTALNDNTQTSIEQAIQAANVDQSQIAANVADSQIAGNVDIAGINAAATTQQTSILGSVYSAIAGDADATQATINSQNTGAAVQIANLQSATAQGLAAENDATNLGTAQLLSVSGALTPVQNVTNANSNSSLLGSAGSIAGLAALALL